MGSNTKATVIIQSKAAWKKEMVKRLKLAFDSLNDTRLAINAHDLVEKEDVVYVESQFQLVGRVIMSLGKLLNQKPEETNA